MALEPTAQLRRVSGRAAHGVQISREHREHAGTECLDSHRNRLGDLTASVSRAMI
jgi:hypothetical protein